MIFRSPHQSLEIPPQSVHEFVLNRAGARGGRAALVDSVTGRTIAYSDLAACVNRVARGLARLGLKKGDVCGVFSPNSIDYPIAVLAMLRLGAIVTTANAVTRPTSSHHSCAMPKHDSCSSHRW